MGSGLSIRVQLHRSLSCWHSEIETTECCNWTAKPRHHSEHRWEDHYRQGIKNNIGRYYSFFTIYLIFWQLLDSRIKRNSSYLHNPLYTDHLQELEGEGGAILNPEFIGAPFIITHKRTTVVILIGMLTVIR